MYECCTYIKTQSVHIKNIHVEGRYPPLTRYATCLRQTLVLVLKFRTYDGLLEDMLDGLLTPPHNQQKNKNKKINISPCLMVK